MRRIPPAGDAGTDPKGHVLEVIAVLLLGVATIGSAWCGYQATRWNGEEAELARESLDARVEASRLFNLATQRVVYDTGFIAQYAQAYADDNQNLMEFYRTSLLRPEFAPILARWEAQVASGGGAPANIFQDEAYLDAEFATYREAEALATDTAKRGDEAGRTADDYVLTTLLLASALFFAGVTTSFRVRFARVVLLAASLMLIAYSASRIIDLPVV